MFSSFFLYPSFCTHNSLKYHKNLIPEPKVYPNLEDQHLHERQGHRQSTVHETRIFFFGSMGVVYFSVHCVFLFLTLQVSKGSHVTHGQWGGTATAMSMGWNSNGNEHGVRRAQDTPISKGQYRSYIPVPRCHFALCRSLH